MTAVPETSDELQELFGDIPRLSRELQDGTFPDTVKAYIGKWQARNEEMAAQFRDQLQLGMQSFLQDQEADGYVPAAGFRGFRPGAAGLPGRDGRVQAAISRSELSPKFAAKQIVKQGLFNGKAPGAGADEFEFSDGLTRYLFATLKGEKEYAKRGSEDGVRRVLEFKHKLEELRNAMSERVPSEGGFLVPENLRSEILMVALETAVMRPRVRVIPMDSLRVPLPSIDDISHTSNVYGGVTASWTEEGASLTASAPSWSRVVLEARKLTAYTSIPNELLQDSITSLSAWFDTFFPEAVAFFEDVAFITGSGVGEPQGILNSPGAVRQPVTSTGAVAFADIANAYARLWPASMNRAVWLCAPDVLPQLLQLAVSASSTGIAPPGFLTQMQMIDAPGSGDGVNYRLLGRPLVVTEKAPAIGGSVPGALTLFDPNYYLLGDRQTMQVASSDEYLFGQDMVAFRAIERLDGRFWLQSPITPENGSSDTLSPLVKIDTTSES